MMCLVQGLDMSNHADLFKPRLIVFINNDAIVCHMTFGEYLHTVSRSAAGSKHGDFLIIHLKSGLAVHRVKGAVFSSKDVDAAMEMMVNAGYNLQ